MRNRARRGPLERRLGAERPQPADEFVSGVAKRITADSEPRRTGWRVALAAGLTALLVGAFALTGGISYAASAVHGGTTAVTSLVTGPSQSNKPEKADKPDKGNKPSSSGAQTSSQSVQSSSEAEDDPEDDDSSADDQYEEKVLICHIPPGNPGNEHTISVSVNAAPAHLAHGDHLGPCDED